MCTMVQPLCSSHRVFPGLDRDVVTEFVETDKGVPEGVDALLTEGEAQDAHHCLRLRGAVLVATVAVASHIE